MSRMISTNDGSGLHQHQDKRPKYSRSGTAPIGNTGSNMTDLNGKNATADDRQTPSKFSNGIGGLFKRLSPNYRSRSKSPAAHAHQRIEKSWVTVEIKDSRRPPSAAAASPMGNYAPPTTSSSSPSSPMLRNGGSSSPDKSPRLRGAWGNLFHRGSMKKPRDSHTPSQIEGRTRSEHELYGNGIDVGGIRMTTVQSADLAGGHWRPAVTMADRLARENGGDIRDGSASGVAARGTLSEEDLVSKSLSQERGDVYKAIITRGGAAAAGVQSAVPAALTTSTAYHSQDSVFDSPSRMPSYVRISCTLSGYRNYRNVDLKAAQSPRQVRSPAKLETKVEIAIQPEHISTTPAVPIGKSIVERRLEKFQQQPAATDSATSPKITPAAVAVTAMDETGTPTPIRDLISNFNKMSIHDVNTLSANRPRQKPPPIPSKRGLLEKFEQAHKKSPLPLIQENELKEGPVFSDLGIGQRCDVDDLANENVSKPRGSLSNGVHDGGDAIFKPFPDSTRLERIVNGAFHGEPILESVTTTVAQRTVDAGMEEAMKHMSASLIQSRKPQQSEVPPLVSQPATVDVSRLITDETTMSEYGQGENATATSTAAVTGTVDSRGDGNKMSLNRFYYQREAAKDRERLAKLCADAEVHLNEEIPDEAAERIRMAVGRVRLFLRKKFAKFEELIEKNLNPVPDDPRPTHVSDLQGYHDLVKLEIEDIDSCFDMVRRLKENNWDISALKDEAAGQSKLSQRPASCGSKAQQPQPPRRNNESTVARAEAAKQRLKKAKEAAMQRKKQAEAEGGFVPEEPVS